MCVLCTLCHAAGTNSYTKVSSIVALCSKYSRSLTFQNLSQAIATDVKAKLHAKVATKDPNPLDSKGRPLPKGVAQKCCVS